MDAAGGRWAGLAALALLLPACGSRGDGTLTPTVAPGIPSNVRSRAGNQSVTVDWTATAAGAQYLVLRSLVPAGPFFPISVPAQFRTPTTYVDAGLTNGTTYYYRVVASNSFGPGPASAVVSATPGFKAASVAAGGTDHLALLPDGSVWEWGQPHVAGISDAPVQVPNLFDITAVSVNTNHSLALGSDGRVWGWGIDTSGQIGTGGPSGTVIPVPVQMINLTDAIAVSAGEQHSLVLTHDGNVWVCGSNLQGQFGQATTSPSLTTTPQQVPGLSNIVAIAAASVQSLALRSDGLVFSWGENPSGQLGNPPVASTPVAPTLISGLNGVVAIAAAGDQSLALRNDGTIWAWGGNTNGELGIGSTSSAVSSPTMTLNLTNVVAIAAGADHGLAVRHDGTVWSWGYNGSGQAGNGTHSATPVSTPVQVLNITDAVSAAASSSNSVALGTDGTVFTWGENVNGGLGNGTGQAAQIPVELPNFTGAVGVGGGNGFSLILRSDGTAWGLGMNTVGQIGNGTFSATVPVSVPTPASGIATATAIAAGYDYGLALLPTGAVMGWGGNNYGQIGDGTSGNIRPSPVAVATPPNIVGVVCGDQHGLAIRNDASNDHTVYTWGYNQEGELGLGVFGGTHATPAQIPSFSGVVSLAAGDRHTIALKSDGTVWVWGSNDLLQLGLGPSGNLAVPTQVPGISGAIAVGAGLFHCLVVLGDGTVLAWGQGTYGQLGNGTISSSDIPVPVVGLSGVTAVTGGEWHSLALKADGTVWAWGYNSNGQLGNAVPDHSAVPVPVLELTGVASISSRVDHNVARLGDGTVWSWGRNIFNQLGVPYVTESDVPVVVSR